MQRQSLTEDLKNDCFLCEKQSDSKGVWNIFLVATNQRQDKIHKKAKEIQDDVLLRKIEVHGESCLDMVVADLRYLNRFGNSISCLETQRYITAMVHKVALQTIDYGVFVPINVPEINFTLCAFDNLDFYEDKKDDTTLLASSHDIYQYQESDHDEEHK